MERTCTMYVGDEKCIQNFSRQSWKEETTWGIRRRWEDIELRKHDVEMWTGFNRLSIMDGGGLLWTQ
jgi:hypothetical protein